jgi:hypothetical protein
MYDNGISKVGERAGGQRPADDHLQESTRTTPAPTRTINHLRVLNHVTTAKKKEKENISLWGSITRARCQDSYFFPGGVLRRRVHPFLLYVLFLLLAIVILSSGKGTFLHLPRWHAAIEE